MYIRLSTPPDPENPAMTEPLQRRVRQRQHSLAILLLLVGLSCMTSGVLAQRPFASNDPFYRNESPRRSFYDGYAVSGEVTYQSNGQAISRSSSNLGLLVQLDYGLGSQFDLSAVVNFAGGTEGQRLDLTWVALKHLWHVDGADMALRLAFEPRPPSNGGLGFRQTDLAFLYSKTLSAQVGTQMAAGVRYVRTGYRGGWAVDAGTPLAGIAYTEATGIEARVKIGYDLIFDPARSHVSLALDYEAGTYDLLERVIVTESASDNADLGEFRGHVLWVRTGLHWHRPTYQIVPTVSVPLMTGKTGVGPDLGKGPRFINLGLRLTLR